MLLNVDAANPRSSLGNRSTINWNNWTLGAGGTTGYNQNGATAENQRVSDTNPWGNTDVVWEARPLAQTNDDGGWNTDWFNIDNTKLYRYSVWVRRTSSTGGGTFYFGMYANGSGSVRMDNNTVETNAYWECTASSNLTQNQWYLWVGYVYPASTTYTGRNPQTGYYTTDGFVGNIGGCNIGTGDLKWSANSTQGIHRTYLYYCSDSTTRLQFYQPRVDVCDGTEPSIQALLQDSGNKWLDVSSTPKAGSLQAAPSYTSGSGAYFTFNGSSQYTAFTSSAFNIPYSGKTVIAFARASASTWTSGVAAFKALFGSPGNRNFNFYVYRDASNLYYMHLSTGVSGSVVGTLSSSLSMTTGTWYMFAVTQSTDGAVNYYLNGSLVTTTSQAFSQYLSTSSENIAYSDNYWNGDISMCSIYTAALSSDQIAQVFNAYRGRYGV
jgi:hypothetical protein